MARILSEHDRTVLDLWLERGGYLVAHDHPSPHLTHDEYGEGLTEAQRAEGDERGGVVGGVSAAALAYARERGWDPDTHCACGDATGERCAWTGPESETVELEWMPQHVRASHVAAGNRGAYPHNGAIRLRVAPSCAEGLLHDDPEWTRRAGEAW